MIEGKYQTLHASLHLCVLIEGRENRESWNRQNVRFEARIFC
jgi:hypothetical protein